MSFKGDLSTIGLAEVFQMISMSQKEGTLVVQDHESRKAIYFGTDGVQLHSAGKRKGFRIGDILVRAGKITVTQLREVLEQQQGSKRMLGQELVAQGLVTDQEIQDVVKSQIEEEIYDLFLWRKAGFEFIEGAPIEELQDPETRAIRLAFDVNSLLLEAVRRTDEWTLINQKIPSMDCIYTFVSSAARDEEDGAATDQTRTVYQYLDGQATVNDVIEQSYVPRFEVCKIIIDLLDRGRIRLLTPTELVTVARRRLEEGNRDKGLRLFGVAAQLAPEDPDLIGKYAHALETEGMVQDAARMYVRVGSLLKQQGQGKDALAYFQRAVSLNPEDIQSKIALFEINLATAGVEEAMATASELVSDRLKERDFETARDVAEQAVAAAPQSLEMRLLLAKVYHQLGLKKERDEVVLFLRKNLPVDQAAADRIIADLRELSEKAAEAAPRVVTAGGRRRRRGGINFRPLAWAALVLLLIAGAGFALYYEMQARAGLKRLLAEAEPLERARKWDEARAKIERVTKDYPWSVITGKMELPKQLKELEKRQRIAEGTTGTGEDPDDKAKREAAAKREKERQEELARLKTDFDEMHRLRAAANFDKALEMANDLRKRADDLGAQDLAKQANKVYDELAPEHRTVTNLRGEADALEAQGKYKDACEIIQRLRLEYNFWKAAQEALFPFAIIVYPPGVRIYKQTRTDPWKEIGVSEAKPLVQHLGYSGKFVLRFEKDGYATRTVEVPDERAGLVRVWLSDRLPKEEGPIGAKVVADPVVSNGLLYLLTEGSERRVYAMKPNRRSPWDERADTAPRPGPDGLVFFGLGDRVVGIDGTKDRGERRVWEFPADATVTTPVCFAKDEKGSVVYFGCGATLLKVDYATRKQVWKQDLPGAIDLPPLELDRFVIVSCDDGSLYAYKDGGLAWKQPAGGTVRSLPALANGVLYVGRSDGRVIALDARTGKVRWTSGTSEQALPGEIAGTPFASGDQVFVAATDGTVACLDAEGKEVWRRKPGAGIRAGVVEVERRVLVGDMKGVFHCLEASDGQPRWRYSTRDAIRTQAMIVDSVIYVVSEGNLYVFTLD